MVYNPYWNDLSAPPAPVGIGIVSSPTAEPKDTPATTPVTPEVKKPCGCGCGGHKSTDTDAPNLSEHPLVMVCTSPLVAVGISVIVIYAIVMAIRSLLK